MHTRQVVTYMYHILTWLMKRTSIQINQTRLNCSFVRHRYNWSSEYDHSKGFELCFEIIPSGLTEVTIQFWQHLPIKHALYILWELRVGNMKIWKIIQHTTVVNPICYRIRRWKLTIQKWTMVIVWFFSLTPCFW